MTRSGRRAAVFEFVNLISQPIFKGSHLIRKSSSNNTVQDVTKTSTKEKKEQSFPLSSFKKKGGFKHVYKERNESKLMCADVA